MAKTSDSLSGGWFERVTIDGEPFVLKHLDVEDDWIMRATGDYAGRPLVLWQSGLLDALPPSIDSALVGCAAGLGPKRRGVAVLMRDVASHLLPDGPVPMTEAEHYGFLDHMAELHARFLGVPREAMPELCPTGNRYACLAPTTTEVEAGRTDGGVPALIAPGWAALRARAPRAAAIMFDLLVDLTPLVRGLEAGPLTLVHGDWKVGNLGVRPDGATILLDWAFPGWAPPPVDLVWYAGVNCDRLPVGHTKERVFDDYRRALVSHGADVEPWWDEQLGLAVLGLFFQQGWSKQGAELEWWAERVVEAARWLR